MKEASEIGRVYLGSPYPAFPSPRKPTEAEQSLGLTLCVELVWQVSLMEGYVLIFLDNLEGERESA
jgi:hypothetical protein